MGKRPDEGVKGQMNGGKAKRTIRRLLQKSRERKWYSGLVVAVRLKMSGHIRGMF